MSDKLVFDLAQEVEGTPNVFVRKDWINILDNQNQNYNNNQSVIDTSQLSNSNKYMSYRESYFSIPMLLTVYTTAVAGIPAVAGVTTPDPTASASSWDYSAGLKNWFGQIIHSFTLDYNGTTIIQQTPYVNMWNSFKLITSLSLNDIYTQGATIGFYPDNPVSWGFASGSSALAGLAATDNFAQFGYGQGVSNNTNYIQISPVSGAFNNYSTYKGNIGFLKRQQYINFDQAGQVGTTQQLTGAVAVSTTYNDLILNGSVFNGAPATGSNTTLTQIWKSYISQKVAGANPYCQWSIMACVYLKHIHSFFNMCPLLKGVFMKMTMNLNNASSTVVTTTRYNAGVAATPTSGSIAYRQIIATACAVSVGGVNPIMIAGVASSGIGGNTTTGAAGGFATSVATDSALNGAVGLCAGGYQGAVAAAATATITYRVNLSVGSTCLDPTIGGVSSGQCSKSIYLYIPAYTFNPVFEQAYLSSPVKQIKYTDIYQYQVLGVSASQQFNNLLTNGIANIKSVLILPYYSTNTSVSGPYNISSTNTAQNGVQTSCSSNTGFLNGVPVWQSPFDPAGTGPTSPCCWFSNFNIQISGQNAIYNVERYNFEQWNNQLYGQNAVNGGLTDGLTSGLIDRQGFDMEYCYYYVNVERMLPVEQSVPKSVQILGQNYSAKALDLYCFIEYGVDISIDALTGARV